MKGVSAALGPSPRRVLLLEPTFSLVAEIAARDASELVVVVSSRRRLLRRCRALVADRRVAAVSLIQGDLEALPFEALRLDAVLLLSGLPPGAPPREQLAMARRLIVPGGTLLLVSRLREGPLGSVTSLADKVIVKRGLPRASDLTAWMLDAGLRKVRQASVRNQAIPRVITWAVTRARPWEGEGAAATGSP